jgi:23S rRNA pseudouridine2605 synthase/16S rRNA pseudouridine516 synthase
MPAIRLQKLLSTAGLASRRTAESLMREGRVSVNGATVTTLGVRADPDVDDVRVDGRRLQVAERRRYILLNKPAGFVSTRTDPRGRKTVLNLLGKLREYLYPVGRLDYDSEGLLIVTNDGELTAALTHPRHGVVKVYEVVVEGVPEPRVLGRMRRGMIIDGRRTAPAELQLRKTVTRGRNHQQSLIEVRLREGRNRQIRRMFDLVGHPVVKLTRVRIGPVQDPRLKPGMWRDLTGAEVEALRRAVAKPRSSAAL